MCRQACREAAQRPGVDRDRGGEHQDDEQHVDAVVARQPGEGPLHAQADDRRDEDGGELGVGGQPLSRRRQHWDHGVIMPFLAETPGSAV
jgi:hypothetical protein